MEGGRTLATAPECGFECIEAGCEVEISARDEVECEEAGEVLNQSVCLIPGEVEYASTEFHVGS